MIMQFFFNVGVYFFNNVHNILFLLQNRGPGNCISDLYLFHQAKVSFINSFFRIYHKKKKKVNEHKN